MGVVWTKQIWDLTEGIRLSGHISQGTAGPFEACTSDEGTQRVTKVGHGFQVDQQLFFRNSVVLPEGFQFFVSAPDADSFALVDSQGSSNPVYVGTEALEVAPGRRGEYLSYGNEFFALEGRDWGVRRDHILAAFPEMATTDRIFVAGCSPLGKLVEAFRDAGYTETFGADDSQWDGPDGDGPAPGVIIVRDNIAAPAIKAALRKSVAQGGTGDDIFDWIITEDMLNSAQDDAEALLWLSVADDILGNASDPTVTTELWRIIHLNSLNVKPPFLSKTLLQWQAMEPLHSWGDSEGRTILRGDQ